MSWGDTIEAWPVSFTIRESPWLFPTMQIVHLLGLTVWLGALFVIDMRILNVGMRDVSIPDLARALRPWQRIGLAFLVTSGVVMFVGEAARMTVSPPFQLKMLLFVAAVLVTALLHRPMVRRDSPPGVAGRFGAILTLALWFMVGFAGRAIGFY